MHGWSSTPTRDLVWYVLGITPAEPGYRRVRVARDVERAMEVGARAERQEGDFGVGAERRAHQAAHDLGRRQPRSRCRPHRRVERKAAVQGRQAAQEDLFLCGQQIVTPIERRAQALVALELVPAARNRQS